MATSHELIQQEFDDHPSLAGSIDPDSPVMQHSPAIEIPSQHSGFRSNNAADSEPSECDSAGPWSPPAWRRPPSGWFQPVDRLGIIRGSPSRSREASPQYDSADDGLEQDLTIPAAHIPLPRSRGTLSASPEKRSTSPEFQSPYKKEPFFEPNAPPLDFEREHNPDNNAPVMSNYVRFAVRAEVQHRTEPIDAAVTFIRARYQAITKSKRATVTFLTLVVLGLSVFRALFDVQNSGPGPDLIKVAGLAKSFEPLIHYSESGVQQIGELQETGVAVWDLGESVRSSNMTSAPIIVRELDTLSESVKTLAIELTKFFANVDGDIDSILIVMDWAKRELSQVSNRTPGSLNSAYENIYSYVHRVGGEKVGRYVTDLFGHTHQQIERATLQRTFNEFLNVLEESINSELHYSTILFGLFESIDRQFLNLQRTVIRETDSQEAEKERKDSELADLWRRAMGANKSRIHKFEKNQALLSSIKSKTVQNKLTLVDHNGKLLKLKSNLEILRKRLVSPLLRNNESSTLPLAEQIEGIDGTYEYLRLARENQKSKLMARLYASSRRGGASIDDERLIDAS